MDLSLLDTDDQPTPSPLTDDQTEAADSLSHRSSPNKMPDEQSSDHGCFSQEKSSDCEGVESSWCSCSLSSGFPLCSETSESNNVKVHASLDSSAPVLPLLPRLSQHQSETSAECHVETKPPLSSTPELSGAFGFESLTDSFGSETCQSASLLRPLSPQSDVLETDASLSELYIFESDTKDFILSQVEIKCPEYRPLPRTEAHYESDAHELMCDSTDIAAGCHHGSVRECDPEFNESEPTPPAADACEERPVPGNDAGQGQAEVAGPTFQRSDSPAELWLDACQFLEGEDADVPDRTGRSVTQRRLSTTSDFSVLLGHARVSGFSPDASEGIGWPGDDAGGRGSRVERWSSVDSWASALSDWTGISEAPPQDFTAAFAEIGAEIDALTQALAVVNTRADSEGRDLQTAEQARARPPAMGVQDQALKEQSATESSIHSSRSCLSLCPEAPGHDLRDREGAQSVESLCDSTQEEPEEQRGSPYTTSRHSPVGSSGATAGSPGGYGVDVTLMPGSTSFADLDIAQFDGYGKSLDSDIFIGDCEPVILNIREETDSDSSSEFVTEKYQTFKDGLCEVTDESSVPQFDWSSGLTESDREEDESAKDPHFLAAHRPNRPRVPDVNTRPGQHINVYTHPPLDTLPDLDGARQVGPEWGSPKFIMPLAPLTPVSSLACRSSSGLEADQTFAKRHLNDNRVLGCDRDVRRRVDGITDKQSPESDEEPIHKKEDTANAAERSSPEEQPSDTSDAGKTTNYFNWQFQSLTVPEDQIFISKKNRIACITLNLNDPFASRTVTPISIAAQTENMPHKTHKGSSEGKTRKKDKAAAHHHGAQAPKKQDATSHHVSAQQTCKKQESHPATGENHASDNTAAGLEAKEADLVIETCVTTEKVASKPHGKKKKKHGQAAAPGGSVGEPPVEAENGAKPKTAKGRIDMFEAKLGVKARKESEQTEGADKKSQKAEVKVSQLEVKPVHHTPQAKNFTSPLSDDIIKRRRLSEDKFGKIVSALESKFPDVSIKPKGEELKADVGANRRKAYSEVVKQKIPPKEDLKVVQPIQAVSVSGDPQSLCLWCQFAAVFSDYTVTWSREGTVLADIKRSAGDESRVSLTINNASHKDLGKYQCRLSGVHGSITLDYVLTYEVLSEIVIPPSPKIISTAPVEQASEEEDVQLSKLMFNEDFLSEQYFGENKPISIITDKSHFGEGMHRRAFRTKLHGGQIPLLVPGHPCVLKVHNAISYGTKNNEELIQKNFTLAVEECHVQNTARKYIKAYTAAAQSIDAFGDVPEIIPIYLIHRPSNDIPYATLEEELIGDFVKYSVKDGKEINLMRRDSEAGQKCCAFQHWVYHNTEGNLLVTDMQGVGMRLTDVGIATCKKGYKGFKGNCATSFIDQFKALHQCNSYCELLGLKSLQPKPKKPASAPKPKPSAAPKKKTFGPTLKSKS